MSYEQNKFWADSGNKSKQLHFYSSQLNHFLRFLILKFLWYHTGNPTISQDCARRIVTWGSLYCTVPSRWFVNSVVGGTLPTNFKNFENSFCIKKWSDLRTVNCIAITIECTTLSLQMFTYNIDNYSKKFQKLHTLSTGK